MHMNNDNDDEKPPDVNNARPRTEKGTKRKEVQQMLQIEEK